MSKSGTNAFHGSMFGFFRHSRLDAADPFATDLVNGRPQRVAPPSNRQQFGGTFGGPIKRDRTMFFASFERLRRRESNAVPVLTDLSIFEPAPAQQLILAGLPAPQAAALRTVLTSPALTRELFATNSGVFPFSSSTYQFSARLDHNFRPSDQVMLRYNYAHQKETNPNTHALVGVSRGYEVTTLDHDSMLNWTHVFNPQTINQMRLQFDYRDFFFSTADRFGPEININGFGLFNRDIALPSFTITRYGEAGDTLNLLRGSHNLKIGGQTLFRGTVSETHVFLGGQFTFGELPGFLVSPALASTTINAMQAFNLGLPQFYQAGFGNTRVGSVIPLTSAFIQDSWRPRPNLTIDAGLRYELDDRTDPIPTDTNNFAPRLGVAWNPRGDGKTVLRGGYGIFYAPDFYQLDWISNALSNRNGKRQIAQLLTTLDVPGPVNPANIFQTLVRQRVINFPRPTRPVTPADLAQFGIVPVYEGPLPPLSFLFSNAQNFENAYAQQANLGIERSLGKDMVLAASYMFGHTLHIMRARDRNLLQAPINPQLGIRV